MYSRSSSFTRQKSKQTGLSWHWQCQIDIVNVNLGSRIDGVVSNEKYLVSVNEWDEWNDTRFF